MPYRDSNWWQTMLTNQTFITFTMIVLASLIGSMSQFFKEGKPFRLGLYLFEVLSSMFAGWAVYFILSASQIEPAWISALCGLASYFGTKFLTLLFSIFTSFIKRKTGGEA